MSTIDAVAVEKKDAVNMKAYKKMAFGVINFVYWILFSVIGTMMFYATAYVMSFVDEALELYMIEDTPSGILIGICFVVAVIVGKPAAKTINHAIFKTIIAKLNK